MESRNVISVMEPMAAAARTVPKGEALVELRGLTVDYGVGERHVEVRIALVERLPVDLWLVHGQEGCSHARKVLRSGVATGEEHAGSLQGHSRVDDVLERERTQGNVQAQQSGQRIAGYAIDRRTGVGTLSDL